MVNETLCARCSKPTYGSLEEWLKRTNTPRHTLAEMAGISPQALSGFLRCNQMVSPRRMKRLADVTGVPMDRLVDLNAFPRGVRDEHAA